VTTAKPNDANGARPPAVSPAVLAFLDSLADLIADAILSDKGRYLEQIEPALAFQRRGGD